MHYRNVPNITDKLFRSVDTLAQAVSSLLLNQSPRDFVSLNTPHDEQTLVMDDGTLITAIRIDGSRKTVGAEEYVTLMLGLEQIFKAYMDDGSHKFTFYFAMDNDKVVEELELIYGEAARKTSRNLNFISEELIDEQIETMAKHCHLERNLLVVHTKVHNLSKKEVIQLRKFIELEHQGAMKMGDAQSIGMGTKFYANKHKTLVDGLIENFTTYNLTSRALTNHEYLYEVRNAYDAAWTDLTWKPFLPGDNYPLRLIEQHKSDFSNYGIPKIAEQVTPRMLDVSHHSLGTVGDTVYAPISVEFSPENHLPFHKLYRSLKAEGIPFRITFDIDSNGMSLFGFKEMLASILMVTPGTDDNKHIVETKKHFAKLRDAGEEIVKLRIMLCTWAGENNHDEASRRREVIARKLQSWGNTQSLETEGDVAESIISSIPGMSKGNAAAPLPSALSESLKILPLSQPASIWEKGSRLYRSMYGKILPMQSVSSLQAHWTKVILGPMGFGKSVELAADNWALVLHPDNEELPFIRQIDIGPGSKGFIELVRSMLPESQRHLAMYERVSNTERHAINMFDTQLGLRFPLSNHASTILNMLTLLCQPDDQDTPYDGTIDVLDRLIKLAYDKLSSRKSSLSYQPKIDVEIDQRLKALNFEPERELVKWWDIVDFFFTKGDKRYSALAQRYAVPDISYIINLCNDPRIASEFADVKTPSTQSIAKFVARKLSGAKSRYPIIASKTAFDISNARIVALDLDDVTKGKGNEAKQRTTLMYMLATHVLTTEIYTGDEHLKEMEGEVGIYNIDYRHHHKQHIALLQRSRKRFCADEVQRGKDVKPFTDTLVTIVLEGRKWLVDVVLGSQLSNAFPDEIIELATSIVILGAGTNKNIQSISEKFGLSDVMKHHLKNSIRQPNSKGATFIGIFDTELGTVEQIMMATQGPQFIWSVNSTRIDSVVRNRLSEAIGATETRQLLVKRYPSGTVRGEVEQRRKALGNDNDFGNTSIRGDDVDTLDDTPDSIIDAIIADNIKYFESNYAT